MKGIRRNAEKSRDRFIQSDELPRFFSALAAEPNETIQDYILLSLLTGARRANVLVMRWSEISFERAEWRITRTKNDDPQTVTLSPEAVEILRSRKPTKSAEFVFPGEGKAGHLVEPKKGWKRVLERAKAIGFINALGQAAWWDASTIEEARGAAIACPNETIERYAAQAKALGIEAAHFELGDLRIHDLRRTLGSWQAKTGASMAIIGKSLSHKSPQTTAIYARLDQDPVRQSVERATTAMLAAAGLAPKVDVVPLKRGHWHSRRAPPEQHRFPLRLTIRCYVGLLNQDCLSACSAHATADTLLQADLPFKLDVQSHSGDVQRHGCRERLRACDTACRDGASHGLLDFVL